MMSVVRSFDPPTQPLPIPVILVIEDMVVTIWPMPVGQHFSDTASRRVGDALRLSLAAFQCTYEQFESELAFLARFNDRPHSARADFLLDVKRYVGSQAPNPATLADEHALRQLLKMDNPLFIHFLEARRDFQRRN
ncbi:hypothetical protein [Arthrobacter sp. OAP107]|uniref:hypothetical protein n=1 Tax=Arthrobacter sp. OAP107 TaxID=3156445 RepID=UPI003394A87F